MNSTLFDKYYFSPEQRATTIARAIALIKNIRIAQTRIRGGFPAFKLREGDIFKRLSMSYNPKAAKWMVKSVHINSLRIEVQAIAIKSRRVQTFQFGLNHEVKLISRAD